MVAAAELLVRDGRSGPRRGGLMVALLILIVLFAGHAMIGRPVVTKVRLTEQGPDAAPAQTFVVTGAPARRLTRDVLSLQQGRIPCGAPGPASAVITVGTVSYDVNGECARVVRLPERPGETVWLESAALHDDLAAALS